LIPTSPASPIAVATRIFDLRSGSCRSPQAGPSPLAPRGRRGLTQGTAGTIGTALLLRAFSGYDPVTEMVGPSAGRESARPRERAELSGDLLQDDDGEPPCA
jgi:hypothetical protein